MLSAEELESEYYRRLEAQKLEQERRKFADSDRDVDLERVWVAYVWVHRKDDPSVGEWKLGGFRRRRNLRRVQTMGRFFAKIRRKLGIDKKLYPVKNTRDGISKKSMIHNGATPQIEVDPESYEVRADGELLTCEPAEVLPMAQRYFMF